MTILAKQPNTRGVYQKVVPKFEAMQWQDTEEKAKELYEWLPDQWVDAPWLKDGKIKITVGLVNDQTVSPGDWIVQSPNGNLKVLTSEQFYNTFEPVP